MKKDFTRDMKTKTLFEWNGRKIDFEEEIEVDYVTIFMGTMQINTKDHGEIDIQPCAICRCYKLNSQFLGRK